MGDKRSPSMFSVSKSLCLLAACVLLAQATPVVNTIHSLRDLPPTASLSQLATMSPRQDAVATYEFLQQSNTDDTKCRNLANAMIDEAEAAIETANKNLENVDVGTDCPKEYAAEVKAANDAVEDNKETTKNLQDAFNTAQAQRVTLTVN